jgi:DNA-binding MarR family transcriptional regulator
MKAKEKRTAVLAEEFSALVTTLRTLHGAWQELPSLFLFELSMAQFKSMMILVSTGGLTARGLAERLRIGASAVTPLVDKLVEQKLVRREDDPVDRRVSWIRPTQEAQELYEKLLSVNQATMAEIVEDLSPEELAEVERGISLFTAAAKRKLEKLRKTPTNQEKESKEKEASK